MEYRREEFVRSYARALKEPPKRPTAGKAIVVLCSSRELCLRNKVDDGNRRFSIQQLMRSVFDAAMPLEQM